jgi:hypothetical protein
MSNDLKDLLESKDAVLMALERFEVLFEEFENSSRTADYSLYERSQLVRLRRAYDQIGSMKDSLAGLKKPVQGEGALRQQASGLTRPPNNPNQRPTKINVNRTLGRMKAEDRALFR